MPGYDIHGVALPDAPTCPPWCAQHVEPDENEVERDGWLVSPFDIIKRCSRKLPPVKLANDKAELELVRYADFDPSRADALHVDAVQIVMDFWTDVTPEQAETFAEALRAAARLARL